MSLRESKIGVVYIIQSGANTPVRRVAVRRRDRANVYEIYGANPIKLHRQSGKDSFLVYPDFETNPHPTLSRSVKLSLRTREIDCFGCTTSTNPPILRRKEAFLTIDHPLHTKFARMSQQEKKPGLLDDAATIGTKEGGQQSRLNANGFSLRGHRLVRH
jgi:DNA phosphorothioation-associated putative methyltransferase